MTPMTTTTTDTVKLTRPEAAYAHLASFQRGDEVDLAGRRFFLAGVVTTAQQDAPRLEGAWLTVHGYGHEATVKVLDLLSGRYTITALADAKAGDIRYFDEAGYATQNKEG